LKISISGSRSLEGHEELVFKWLDQVCEQFELKPERVKSGGARGFDRCAEDYFKLKYGICKENGTLEVLPPKYEDYPLRLRWKAPLERNGDIVKGTDICIAMFNGTNPNKGGTNDAVRKALALGIPVIYIDVKNGHVRYRSGNGQKSLF
jgi:hypothetical protein